MSNNPRYKNYTARVNLRKHLLATQTICPLCGLPLPTAEERAHMSRSDPRFPVVDEIVPISKGGSPIDKRNTQLVHNRCNQIKGAKLLNQMQKNHDKPPIRHSRNWYGG